MANSQILISSSYILSGKKKIKKFPYKDTPQTPKINV